MNTLIKEAKNGSYEALSKLYEGCRKKGLSVANQYVKNDTDSEDMYQDAFLKAMENIDKFDENRDFQPWLDTIIVNTCKDFLRKKRPLNFTDMSDEESEFVDTIESSDVSSLPESSYVRREMLTIVDGIVEMLPSEQKEATFLFYFKDFTVKQVAEYQHVSEDTVKSRLSYSRKKVEQATRDYERKNGIKISIATVIPALFVLYFKNSAYASEFEAAFAAISASGGYTGTGAMTMTGAAVVNAGTSAGKIAAWKIIAIISACIIAAAGGVFAINKFTSPDNRREVVTVSPENTSEISEDQTEKDTKPAEPSVKSEENGPEPAWPEPAAEKSSPSVEAVRNAKIGDIVEYGSYEQDGDDSNGTEPIEWQVIANEDGKKLLLSKYILIPLGNMMEFPGDGVNYTWKECGIRTYLNGDFYESAFTDEERENIAKTQIRTTWSDACSLGAELVDVETITKESIGTVFSYEEGRIVTTDKIFIPDFKEDLVRYMNAEEGSQYGMYGGTDILAKATVASGLPNIPYEQWCYDEAKALCSKDLKLDESLIGEEFGNFIMRNGGSANWEQIKTTDFHVMYGYSAASYSPWPLNSLCMPSAADIGIRPMMWVEADPGKAGVSSQDLSGDQSVNTFDYSDANVGDLIKFGHYEQDRKTSNGKEEIEWLVLSKEDDRMLVISRYVLDWAKYNEKLEDVTWEDCTLRNWLNDSFYNTAFTSQEQKKIVAVTNDNPDSNAFFNSDYAIKLEVGHGTSEPVLRGQGADGGNETRDNVFCLSYEEALSCFESDEERKCAPTRYAMSPTNDMFTGHVWADISAGKTEDGIGMCGWWLRSPGSGQEHAMVVQSGGYIRGRNTVQTGIYGVRPAIWLSSK